MNTSQFRLLKYRMNAFKLQKAIELAILAKPITWINCKTIDVYVWYFGTKVKDDIFPYYIKDFYLCKNYFNGKSYEYIDGKTPANIIKLQNIINNNQLKQSELPSNRTNVHNWIVFYLDLENYPAHEIINASQLFKQLIKNYSNYYFIV